MPGVLTEEEFAALSEPDDGSKEELVRGKITRTPIPKA